MRNFKKGISLVLAGIMILGSLTPILATVNEKQTTNTSETLATDVYFNQDSSFTVTIPKLVTLDSTKTSAYEITVTGDIASDEVVMVVPEETFKMYDQATIGTTKTPVDANVSQNKTFWKFNEFETIGNGTISATNLTAGNWKGSFWFNIKLQSNYISVNAKNEAGEDINASATNIVGEEKENLLNSLEESGLIESKEEVDAIINVKSDDFEGMAETTFDVSNIAKEGDKVAILHFDEEKQEWELIGTETVDENGKITGNFTSYSPVVFVKIDENGNLEHIHVYKETIEESTCIKEGVKTFTCGCGDKYTETIAINASNHSGTIVNAGTESVHTKYSCCNATVSTQHSFTSSVTKEATCEVEGIMTHSCSCGYKYTNEIQVKGHDIVSGICKNCGAVSIVSDFSSNSWEAIAKACQTNAVPDTWKVGDIKTMKIAGVEYEVAIIGKNHDTYADGSGIAPLTFQLVNTPKTKYKMNNSNTSKGSWAGSVLYTTLNTTILNTLETDVKNNIKAVCKITNVGGTGGSTGYATTTITSHDKLFLLSANEIDGSQNYIYAEEGTQYEYYKISENRFKYDVDGTAVTCWLRTPNRLYTGSFHILNTQGIAFGSSRIVATDAYCVAFAFCF